jgi:sugar O-acyltransferase (sialic acid O-acetyltransferase NeuD family)
MKSLIIIGARGYGREIYHLATQCKEYKTEWDIKGFLDDHSEALNGYSGYPSIIGPVETYEIQPGDLFVCALGNVHFKNKYVSIIKSKGGIFTSLIHPSSMISLNTQYGEGFIVCQYVNVSCDIVIGHFVTIQPFTEIGHDVIIGDHCHLNSHSFLGGYVRLGNYVTVHSGAKIIPRLKIGNNSVIGAGSVVTKNVPEGCTVFGNPATVIFAE